MTHSQRQRDRHATGATWWGQHIHPNVPGFSSEVIWDSPTEPVSVLVPDEVKTTALPTPGRRALKASLPADTAEQLRLAITGVGGLAGAFAWYLLALPHLRGETLWVTLIAAVGVGAMVAGLGFDARRRSTLQARREAWKTYRDELDPMLSKVIRAEEDVVDVAESALRQHRRTARAVAPWPDLGRGLPDLPAMTSRLLHAHLAAHTDEAQQEAHERDEIDAILKLTTAPVEDEDLARLQVRQSELAERDHRRHHLFDDAREQLSTAEKQAKHLEATALARTHNSRNQAHAPAERN